MKKFASILMILAAVSAVNAVSSFACGQSAETGAGESKGTPVATTADQGTVVGTPDQPTTPQTK